MFQLALVLGEPEKVVLFLHLLKRTAGMLEALPVLIEFVPRIKKLAPHAIEAAIRLGIDITALAAAAPELLARLDVHLARRAKEYVELHIQRLREFGERGAVPVAKFPRRDALLLRRLDVLERILVGAGDVTRFEAALALVARDRIALHEFLRMSKVRLGVHVRNGGREVKLLFLHCC